jgi:hypothetical protein
MARVAEMDREVEAVDTDELSTVVRRCQDDLKYLYRDILLDGSPEYQDAIEDSKLHDLLFDFLRWEELGQGLATPHTELKEYVGDGTVWLHWRKLDEAPLVYKGDEHELAEKWKRGELLRGVIIRLAGDGHNKYVLLPRFHLKTEIAHVAFTLQEIIRDPSIRTMSKTHTRPLAEKIIERVKDAWKLERFSKYFGQLKPDIKEAGWNERYIQVRAPRRGVGHTVEASAVEVETVGSHPDLIILDDVIGFENLSKKEKVRAHVETLAFVLGAEGRVLGIGTRYAPDDPHGLFLDHGTALFKSTSFIFATLEDEDKKSVWNYMTDDRLKRLRERCSNEFTWFCVPDGTLVMTQNGLTPIEDIQIGDKALTHNNRFRTVVNKACRISDTVTLKGQGHCGFEITPNHKLWMAKRGWSKNGKKKWLELPRWLEAESAKGMAWATPTEFPPSTVPEIKLAHGSEIPIEITPALLKVVGLYVGDGSMDGIGLAIVSSLKDEDIMYVKEAIEAAGMTATLYYGETTARFHIQRKALARWIKEHFGRYSGKKRIPGWIYGLPLEYRKNFLDGYLYADGCELDGRRQLTTVNRGLALGVKILANSIGIGCSVAYYSKPGSSKIRGRTIERNPFYMVNLYDSSRSSFEFAGHRYGYVRSVSPCRKGVRVWNIEVDEDHSYVADGIVVKNCQLFNNPFQVEAQKLKSEWWRKWPRPADTERLSKYLLEGQEITPELAAEYLHLDICVTLDPASSERKRSDCSACIVQGQTQDREFRLVLDGFRKKLSRDELPGVFVDLLEKWLHITRRARTRFVVGVEESGLGTYLKFPIEDAMRKRGFNLEIQPLKHRSRAKVDRIYRLASPYRLGSILYPEKLDCGGYDLIEILKHQYLHFPRGGEGEDDLLDAQAYQEDLLLPINMPGRVFSEKQVAKANDVVDVPKPQATRGMYVPESFVAQKGRVGRWVPQRFNNA